MASRRNVPYIVEFAKYSTFKSGSPVYELIVWKKVTFDDLPVDLSVPKFSVAVNDYRGRLRGIYNGGDIVRIRRGGELVFLGIIDTFEPDKGDGQTLTVGGIPYYYHTLLANSTVSRDAFKEGGKPSAWRFGRTTKDDSGVESLVDGLRPDEILKALLGYKLYVQEFFENLDGIDNVDWLNNNLTDVTSGRLTNPSFEDGQAGWTVFSGNSDEYENGETLNNITSNGVSSLGPYAGIKAWAFSTQDSSPVDSDDFIGIYQDNVTLNPDDIVYFRAKLLANSEVRLRPIVMVFKNGSFSHPFTDQVAKGLILSNQNTALTTAYSVSGGVFTGSQAGTFRVAVGLFATDLIESDHDIRIDDVKIVTNSAFNGVVLLDGKLQLKKAGSTVNDDDEEIVNYYNNGTAKSISFYHLNPNVKQPGAISGTISVKVRGNVYKESASAIVRHPKIYVAIDDGAIWTSMPLANQVTLTAKDPITKASIADGAITDGQDLLWEGGITTAGLSTSGAINYKLRYKVALESGDGLGTTKVDYLRVEADSESFLREVTTISPFTYAHTSTAPSLGTFETYTYPSELDGVAATRERKATFAHEFFYDTILDGIATVLKATVKPSTVTITDPITKSFATDDANWEFQISHRGIAQFKQFIGRYYGKDAGAYKKQYSFASRNLKRLTPKTQSRDIINNLTYIAEGLATLDTLILDGSAFINATSVATYGMRIGKITERDITDVDMATGRAHALLRQMATPTESFDVEIFDELVDEWKIGDVLYFYDLDSGMNDDFRVIEKKYDVDSDGENVTVRLATKNRSIAQFVETVSSKFRQINNHPQGSLVVNPGGEIPKYVNRDVVYQINVEIPDDAARRLQRVMLNLHSESALTTGATANGTFETTTSGAHVHGDGSHSHPIPISFFQSADTFRIALQGVRDPSTGQLVFPVNVVMSINDPTGTGVTTPTVGKSGPYTPFGVQGVNEFGDLSDSQTRNVGFDAKDMDISDAFKDADGAWYPGVHALYFIARGTDSSTLNPDNIGVLSGSVRLTETVTSVPPA